MTRVRILLFLILNTTLVASICGAVSVFPAACIAQVSPGVPAIAGFPQITFGLAVDDKEQIVCGAQPLPLGQKLVPSTEGYALRWAPSTTASVYTTAEVDQLISVLQKSNSDNAQKLNAVTSDLANTMEGAIVKAAFKDAEIALVEKAATDAVSAQMKTELDELRAEIARLQKELDQQRGRR